MYKRTTINTTAMLFLINALIIGQSIGSEQKSSGKNVAFILNTANIDSDSRYITFSGIIKNTSENFEKIALIGDVSATDNKGNIWSEKANPSTVFGIGTCFEYQTCLKKFGEAGVESTELEPSQELPIIIKLDRRGLGTPAGGLVTITASAIYLEHNTAPSATTGIKHIPIGSWRTTSLSILNAPLISSK